MAPSYSFSRIQRTALATITGQIAPCRLRYYRRFVISLGGDGFEPLKAELLDLGQLN